MERKQSEINGHPSTGCSPAANRTFTRSDDGINGAGGVDGSSVGGRPGQNPFWESGNCRLDINGGYIAVDALGDGIDINGPIEMIRIETQDSRDLLTFVPTKTYQSVVFSSPALENGLTCVIYTGGSSTGSAADGLYSGGTYTAGNQVDSLTISDIVTGSGGFPGAPGFPGGRP